MSRLIDADALLEQMKHRKEYVGRPSDPVCLVEDAPTVDAVPVKHGRWKGRATGLFRCSECDGLSPYQFKYCRECGAKMDGERKNT